MGRIDSYGLRDAAAERSDRRHGPAHRRVHHRRAAQLRDLRRDPGPDQGPLLRPRAANACRTLRDTGFSGQCVQFGSRVYTWKGGGLAAGYVIAIGVSFANIVLLQGIAGASIGKLIVGLRVVNGGGAVCGIGRAFVRWLLLIVDAFLLPRRSGHRVGHAPAPARRRHGRRHLRRRPRRRGPSDRRRGPAYQYGYGQPGPTGWAPPGGAAPGWSASPPAAPPGWGAPPPANRVGVSRLPPRPPRAGVSRTTPPGLGRAPPPPGPRRPRGVHRRPRRRPHRIRARRHGAHRLRPHLLPPHRRPSAGWGRPAPGKLRRLRPRRPLWNAPPPALDAAAACAARTDAPAAGTDAGSDAAAAARRAAPPAAAPPAAEPAAAAEASRGGTRRSATTTTSPGSSGSRVAARPPEPRIRCRA